MFGVREGLAHVVNRGVEEVLERLAQRGGASSGKASVDQSQGHGPRQVQSDARR